MIKNTLHRKLKIEQHDPTKKKQQQKTKQKQKRKQKNKRKKPDVNPDALVLKKNLFEPKQILICLLTVVNEDQYNYFSVSQLFSLLKTILTYCNLF